jgi:monovalent cation:H+ antiporter-2, CPA2 family
MGTIGRTVADALTRFRLDYIALERDESRLKVAVADGYNVYYGDGFDMRMWESIGMREKTLSVLTRPDVAVLSQTAPIIQERYPDLRRFAIAASETEAALYRAIGLSVILDQGLVRGVDAAAGVLRQLGISEQEVTEWAAEHTLALNPPLEIEIPYSGLAG